VTVRRKKWRVRTTDDNNKAGNSQFDEPSRADLTFRVFFIVFWMSPQRIRDIQLKSKHLDREGGKTSSWVKGLRRKKKIVRRLPGKATYKLFKKDCFS